MRLRSVIVMLSNLLVRIDLSRKDFSKGQRKIADYIEEHYDSAAFMTAAKLGEVVGVSESTVVRFATQIGYDGFPYLQKAMQEMIRDKLNSIQRIEVTTGRIGDSDVVESVLNQDIDKIRRGFTRGFQKIRQCDHQRAQHLCVWREIRVIYC